MISTKAGHMRKNNAPSGLKEKMEACIKKHSMLQGGETVLVGLSGGPDSVCLLTLMNRLKDEFCLTLSAVYVNHNLRPDEVHKEIEFCREFCNQTGVSFISRSVDVKSYARDNRLNIQEAARELRYRVFDETAFETNAERIALAHNADDQVETFFMRALRGSGPGGLSGIPARRGKIIRPLIEMAREEIEHFLESENISFVIDSSNLKTEYFRNSVRQKLMPVLRDFNPQLTGNLLTSMAILSDEERYFDIIVTRSLMKMISRKSDNRIELFLAPLENLDVAILRRVLRRVVAETKGLRGIGFVHIEDIISLIRGGRSGDRLLLPNGIRVIRGYSLLVVTTEALARISVYELQPPGELSLREAGAVIRVSFEESEGDLGDGKSSVLLDAGSMKFPLTVRARIPGDFFFPLGFGKRKKLQDFFVDAKVPRDERDSVPVVLSGEDIVWIAGHRADDRFKVTQNTNKFVRSVLLKGNF